jgi:hypothetical protein
MLATDLQAIMLDCNTVAGRRRKFIVGLCVITATEGTVSFFDLRERM